MAAATKYCVWFLNMFSDAAMLLAASIDGYQWRNMLGHPECRLGTGTAFGIQSRHFLGIGCGLGFFRPNSFPG
ncbi:hypothetical protein QBC42DRAFT_258951 [Cladorrhinum samala]|uniref:CASP-like protein n=1 Tax=Cladorrhinum samala TaxID=585594 RepID=A0AAV9I4C8_9PEZI|nr:hypothetical protein QBC42DRAFT_258951 [Cladorrhinum samala]